MELFRKSIMEYRVFRIIGVLLLALQLVGSEEDPPRNTKLRTARIDGDIVLGALFPVHYKPPKAFVFSRACGKIREFYGIQRIETLFYTLDKINENDKILPNVTLGVDIRDSCWYSSIALEQSIDFIKDAIASNTELSNNVTDQKGCRAERLKPIAGLVGPGSSDSSVQIQNLLQIFHIPQIGYSATSMSLSDKGRFGYFLRVVPPDNYQAQALIDLVVNFNWTYISTVHTEGNYGERGIEEFETKIRQYNVCISSSGSVSSTADEMTYETVIDRLERTPNATVVVCFCEGMTVRNLLKAAKNKNVGQKYLFIGSDGWGNRQDVVEDIEEVAVGGISVKLYSPRLGDFDGHYSNLKPHNNSRNPWFKEFWQEKFECRLDAGDDTDYRYNQTCTDEQTLADTKQDSKLGFVENAVYTMAYALHNMHRDVCGGVPGLREAMQPINGSIYLKYLLNVTFNTYSGEEVRFDDNGDPPGRYEFINYQPALQPDGNTTYSYVTIGTWKTGILKVNESLIHWPRIRGSSTLIPESICSRPCPKGHVKDVKGVTCCWACIPCKENETVVDETTCQACAAGLWPNHNLSACEEIPIEFTSWDDSGAIVAMTIACLGILLTVWIASVFIRHNNTPVVKASTRELSYIILFGIIVACCSNFVIVAKPSIVTCNLSRILPGLAFSLMYGALVTKTNRIARILEGSKKIMTKKPRFMSASAQVLITGIIIGVESAIITVMLIIEPADSKLDYSVVKRVRLVCHTTPRGVIVPLGFDLLLIIMCTLYAIKTRNLPENFNEAKFIGFTMYTTCVIWTGFFPIYFGGESRVITMCISITLSAMVALVLLFFPKVYIIIWAPEKNTRGAFTTSKDVRCHIGSKSMPSGDSMEYKDMRYDGYFKSDVNRKGDKWKNKSLDEKKLNTVMRRSNFQEGEDNPFINHHLIPPNQRQYAVAEMNTPEAGKRSGRFTNEAANRKSVEEDIAEFCEQFPSEEKETSLCERPRKCRGGMSTTVKDSQCQTDYNVFMTLEPTCRRRIKSPYTSPINKRCRRITPNPPPSDTSASTYDSRHLADTLPLNYYSRGSRSGSCEQLRSNNSTQETSPLLEFESEKPMKRHTSFDGESNEFKDMYTLECSVSPSHCSDGYRKYNNKNQIIRKPNGNHQPYEPLVLKNAYAESNDSLLKSRDSLIKSLDNSPTKEKARRYFASVNSSDVNHRHSDTNYFAGATNHNSSDTNYRMKHANRHPSVTSQRSGSVLSQSSVSSGTSGNKSAEELSLFSLSALENEENDVAHFQDYLQQRGLQLDMSSVQTSDL